MLQACFSKHVRGASCGKSINIWLMHMLNSLLDIDVGERFD